MGASSRADELQLPRHPLAGIAGAGDQSAPDPDLHSAVLVPDLPGPWSLCHTHADSQDFRRVLPDHRCLCYQRWSTSQNRHIRSCLPCNDCADGFDEPG